MSLAYRGHLLEDLRFDADARITVGEGDASIVVPGVERAVLVEQGEVQHVDGLQLQGPVDQGVYHLALHDAPDVTLRVQAQHGALPAMASTLRLPARELIYGFALVGFLMSLAFAFDVFSGVEIGGRSSETGRMQRAMLGVDAPTPTLALFSEPVRSPRPIVEVEVPTPRHPPSEQSADAPEQVETVEATAAVGAIADEAASDEERAGPAPLIAPPKVALPSKSRARSASRRTDRGPRKGRPDAQHSHDAHGQREAGGGPGNAVEAAPACADPHADPKQNVDVVFVIDVSTTMAFALDHLAEEIAALDESVRRHDPERRYGLVLFVDDVLVVDGNPYTDVGALRGDFAKWARFTSTNRQLRSADKNLDWPENGLDALMAATQRFDWRDAGDTLRLVVYASDDDFGEAGNVQSGQLVHSTYVDTVKTLQESSIRVASFTAPIGGKCECEDVRAGFLAPYQGQDSIPVATGGAGFDIDEVAGNRLHFDRALTGLIDNLVCD